MSSELPPGHLRKLFGPVPPNLLDASIADLATALLTKIRAGAPLVEVACPIERLHVLGLELELGCNHRNNRFSRQGIAEVFWTAFHPAADLRPRLDGATVVELGSGSMNPLAVALTFLLAGARRAVAIDLDRPQDIGSALRGLAQLASWLLTDPRLVLDGFGLTREMVAARLEGFDLGKLWYGDPTGIDASRLELRHDDVSRLSFAAGEVDCLLSRSMLEHLPDLDAAIAEMARVTAPGGIGAHSFDGLDHRHYGDARVDPLEFLRDESRAPLIAGCNRVRPLQIGAMFERHGFEVRTLDVHGRVPMDAARRASFAEPFRSMSLEELSVVSVGVHVRRR